MMTDAVLSWVLAFGWRQILAFGITAILVFFIYRFLVFDEDGALSAQEKVRITISVVVIGLVGLVLFEILYR